jgi:hypothetical protein
MYEMGLRTLITSSAKTIDGWIGLDYIANISWVLILKYLDDFEPAKNISRLQKLRRPNV